jgi:hypothetical protein
MRASVSASGAEADAFCTCPALSADGQYVAFKSPAAVLVAEDTNAMIDVFVAPTNTLPQPFLSIFPLAPLAWERGRG